MLRLVDLLVYLNVTQNPALVQILFLEIGKACNNVGIGKANQTYFFFPEPVLLIARFINTAYDKGRGVRSDPIKAVQWFNKAATAGNKEAAYALALMYVRKNSFC